MTGFMDDRLASIAVVSIGFQKNIAAEFLTIQLKFCILEIILVAPPCGCPSCVFTCKVNIDSIYAAVAVTVIIVVIDFFIKQFKYFSKKILFTGERTVIVRTIF